MDFNVEKVLGFCSQHGDIRITASPLRNRATAVQERAFMRQRGNTEDASRQRSFQDCSVSLERIVISCLEGFQDSNLGGA